MTIINCKACNCMNNYGDETCDMGDYIYIDENGMCNSYAPRSEEVEDDE